MHRDPLLSRPDQNPSRSAPIAPHILPESVMSDTLDSSVGSFDNLDSGSVQDLDVERRTGTQELVVFVLGRRELLTIRRWSIRV